MLLFAKLTTVKYLGNDVLPWNYPKPLLKLMTSASLFVEPLVFFVFILRKHQPRYFITLFLGGFKCSKKQ